MAERLRTPSDVTSSTSPPPAGTTTLPPRANESTAPVRASRTIDHGMRGRVPPKRDPAPDPRRRSRRGSAGARVSAAGDAGDRGLPARPGQPDARHPRRRRLVERHREGECLATPPVIGHRHRHRTTDRTPGGRRSPCPRSCRSPAGPAAPGGSPAGRRARAPRGPARCGPTPAATAAPFGRCAAERGPRNVHDAAIGVVADPGIGAVPHQVRRLRLLQHLGPHVESVPADGPVRVGILVVHVLGIAARRVQPVPGMAQLVRGDARSVAWLVVTDRRRGTR